MTYSSVRRWLQEQTPIEPSLLEGASLDVLIAERLPAFGNSESAYIAQLARSSDEVDRLIAAIAVPETWLFRYPRSFDLLLEFLRRRLAESQGPLRMLSIGCATGQEPFCMAMTALHAGWPAERIEIVGLDRNERFLSAAADARYGPASVRTEIPAWAMAYLNRSGDTITIDPAVRALVRFARVDVTAPEALRPYGPCDAIFCRNLLIYLNPTARQRLLDAISAQLAPGALLFVGHAEQAMRSDAPLRPVAAPHAFALQIGDRPSPVVLPAPAPVRIPARPAIAPRAPVAPARREPAPVVPSREPEESLEAARELADSGRTDEAETMVRAILARRGPSAAAMELLGMIRISLNDLPGARRHFEQAVYLEPDRAASLLQLALISERSGDARRAATYWDRACRAPKRAHEERRP